MPSVNTILAELEKSVQKNTPERALVIQLSDSLSVPYAFGYREALALIYKQTFAGGGFLDASVTIKNTLLLSEVPRLKDWGPFDYKSQATLYSLLGELSQAIVEELPALTLNEFNQTLKKELEAPTEFFDEFKVPESSEEVRELQERLNKMDERLEQMEKSEKGIPFDDVISTIESKGFVLAEADIIILCKSAEHTAQQKAIHIAERLLGSDNGKSVELGINLLKAAFYNGKDLAAEILADHYKTTKQFEKALETYLMAYKQDPKNSWVNAAGSLWEDGVLPGKEELFYDFFRYAVQHNQSGALNLSTYHLDYGSVEESALYYYLQVHGIPESGQLDKDMLLEILKSTLECVESGFRVERVLPNYDKALQVVEIFQCLDPSFTDLSAYGTERILPGYAAVLKKASGLMKQLKDHEGLTDERIEELKTLHGDSTPLKNIVAKMEEWVSLAPKAMPTG